MKLKTVVCFLTLLLLTACSSSGLMRAQHNGKTYWNPGSCFEYQWYDNNPDVLYCMEDGQRTGVVMRPANQQDINNIYREQEIQNNMYNNINNNANTLVNCHKIADRSIYKQIFQFNGFCPPGYMQAY